MKKTLLLLAILSVSISVQAQENLQTQTLKEFVQMMSGEKAVITKK